MIGALGSLASVGVSENLLFFLPLPAGPPSCAASVPDCPSCDCDADAPGASSGTPSRSPVLLWCEDAAWKRTRDCVEGWSAFDAGGS